jgi:hypothetical protein
MAAGQGEVRESKGRARQSSTTSTSTIAAARIARSSKARELDKRTKKTPKQAHVKESQGRAGVEGCGCESHA